MKAGRESIFGLLAEIAVAFAFLSRLPVPSLEAAWRRARLADALRFAPIVGAGVAAAQALVLLGCTEVRCPALVSCVLAIIASVGLTGALHEDGLADVADSFGGADRERKLAIMRDSRIGSFGALALITSVMLRIAALSALLSQAGVAGAIGALFIAAPSSRALMLVPLAALPPARSDGMARSAGKPGLTSLLTGFALAGVLAIGAVWLTPTGPAAAILAESLAGAACVAVTVWARRTLGGVTGDTVGACQQVTETVFLLALSCGR